MFYVNVSLDELMDKYELDMLKNLNNENVNKIIEFLYEENVDYIDEIIENKLIKNLKKYPDGEKVNLKKK